MGATNKGSSTEIWQAEGWWAALKKSGIASKACTGPGKKCKVNKKYKQRY